MDPDGQIVQISPGPRFDGGTVKYVRDSGIVFYESSLWSGTRILNDEEYVRAYLVVRLIRELGYPPHSLELEYTYTIGRPSATSAQIDVRVLDRRNPRAKTPDTFMLIEVKRPGDFGTYGRYIEDQLFAPARDEYPRGNRYGIWYTVNVHAGRAIDRCIVVDTRKYFEHEDWVAAGEPGHNFEIPDAYGAIRKQPYIKGVHPLRTDVDRAEMSRLQKDLHNRLWGGKLGDNDVFRNVVKLLLAKIYDEKQRKDGEPYRFQVEVRDGTPESSEQITAKVRALYSDALRHHFRYDKKQIEQSAINETQLPPNKIAYVVEQLEGISIVENSYDDDLLGSFFEGIVGTGFRQGKGQFFTHSNIARFMLYALELDEWAIESVNGVSPTLPQILDPSCGSGTFLVEAMRVVTRSVLETNAERVGNGDYTQDFVDARFRPNRKNKNSHNVWAQEFVYGIEDSEDLAMAAKVNMILHGDGSAHIYKADGLGPFMSYPQGECRYEEKRKANSPYPYAVNERFDCIVSNPPFSLKEEGRTLSEYMSRFLFAEKKQSENLFLERWYQFLRPAGRLAVVLPDSVFDTGENLYIRLFLYRFFHIRAIVSLPLVTFQPYTPTKTSLLFAVKKERDEVDQWDQAWSEAVAKFQRLRRTTIIQHVLTNERLRTALIRATGQAAIEWYPDTNLLTRGSLPESVRSALLASAVDPESDASGDAEPDALQAPPTRSRLKAPKRGAGSAARLKTLEKLLADYDELVQCDELGSIASEPSKTDVLQLLRDRLPSDVDALSLPRLLEIVYNDVLEAAELNFSNSPAESPYANAWWCFAEVTSDPRFDAQVVFAEASDVGYKRSKRHPGGAPTKGNDLFNTDTTGNLVIDTANPTTILDVLRARKVYGRS